MVANSSVRVFEGPWFIYVLKYKLGSRAIIMQA